MAYAIPGLPTPKRRRAAMQVALYTSRKDNRTDAKTVSDTTALAWGSIIFAANPSNNDTITLGGTAVTFGSDVTIGGSLAVTLASLLTFLNASANVNIVKAKYVVSATALGVRSKTPDDVTFTLAASVATVSHATLQLPQVRQRAAL